MSGEFELAEEIIEAASRTQFLIEPKAVEAMHLAAKQPVPLEVASKPQPFQILDSDPLRGIPGIDLGYSTLMGGQTPQEQAGKLKQILDSDNSRMLRSHRSGLNDGSLRTTWLKSDVDLSSIVPVAAQRASVYQAAAIDSDLMTQTQEPPLYVLRGLGLCALRHELMLRTTTQGAQVVSKLPLDPAMILDTAVRASFVLDESQTLQRMRKDRSPLNWDTQRRLIIATGKELGLWGSEGAKIHELPPFQPSRLDNLKS